MAEQQKPNASEATATSQRPALERGLKWVAAITAVLSLFFALQQLTRLITENNAHERQITELKQLAQLQRGAGDYSPAWDSLGAALKLAESGGTLAKLIGHLDAQTVQLRGALEDVAMAWLDDIHKPSDQKFSDIVDKLLPALEQGAISAPPQRKADLLAHIGWAYFLRSRDGVIAPDPQRQYEQALQLDSGNSYAHAYLGHWMMWNGGSIPAATEHFIAALKANRAKDLVRTLQLAAYNNRQSDGDVYYVATVAEMLKSGENVAPDSRHTALWHITRACGAHNATDFLTALKRAIPAKDLLAEYTTLRADPSNQQRDDAVTKKVAACIAASK